MLDAFDFMLSHSVQKEMFITISLGSCQMPLTYFHFICVFESCCDHKLSKNSFSRRVSMPTVGGECNLMNISNIMNINKVFKFCAHIIPRAPLLQNIFLRPCYLKQLLS